MEHDELNFIIIHTTQTTTIIIFVVNILISISSKHSPAVVRNNFSPAYFHLQRTLTDFFETVYGLCMRHPVDGFIVHTQYLITCKPIETEVILLL